MEIDEGITIVTLVEFPSLLEYAKFQGNIIYPTRSDLELAIELQLKLRSAGKPKPFSDLLIAAICINRDEELVTKDRNFQEIAEVSNLKVKIVE
jgi:predicted nucleic acid-binding protein